MVFPTKTLYTFLFYHIDVTCSIHLILIYNTNNIWKAVQIWRLLSTQFSSLPPHTSTYDQVSPSAPFSPNFILHSFLNISDQVPFQKLLFLVQQPLVGPGLLFHDVSRLHTTTHYSRQDSSGRVVNPSQRPLPNNTQHSQQTNIHAHGGIRNHILSRRAAVDLRLRPRGHWERRTHEIQQEKSYLFHVFYICFSLAFYLYIFKRIGRLLGYDGIQSDISVLSLQACT